MIRSIAAVAACVVLAQASLAQSTAFTFQGALKSNGTTISGLHDFRFRLFDSASGGAAVGSQVCVDNVQVTDGNFNAAIDFGQAFAAIATRYLEIEVRRDTGLNCGSAGSFVILAPRQAITPAPRATAASVANVLAAPDGSPSNALVVDNAGNIGIGMATPTTSLDVQAPAAGATAGAGVRIRGFSSGVDNQAYMDFFNGAGTRIGYVGDGGGADNSIYLQSDSASVHLYTAVGSVVTATPSGNAGIGTASPATKLHVNGQSMWLTGGNGGALPTSAGGGLRLYDDGVRGNVFAWNYANNTSRALILQEPGGNVGIGTTNPTSKLTVAGGADITGGLHVADRIRVADGPASIAYVAANAPNVISGGVGFSADIGRTDAAFCTGVRAEVQTSEVNSQAIYAVGRFRATGTKSFCIDHPDDPTNKYLLHYCPESPEAINFYRGTTALDANGRAIVHLPEYFAKINTRPTYQLTPVGVPMPSLHISARIDDRALAAGAVSGPDTSAPACWFTIAGGVPGGEVCWRVEAVRNDPWVQLNGAPVELHKPPHLRGTYEHPSVYGQPEERGASYRLQDANPHTAAR